jgi:DNA-binding MarR family transcriptional regulator
MSKANRSTAQEVSFAATRHVRDTCLCLHAQRAARALARRFDAALKPARLTNGQFSLLMALNRAEPPGVGEISAVLAMDRTTVTAKLKPLEREGLVRVRVDAADKRGRRVQLTAAGRKRLAAALPLWLQEHGAIERELAIDVAALRRGLRALT